MFISHPNQATTIQLANVASIYYDAASEFVDNKSKITFCFATMNENDAYTEEWRFNSKEEAQAVHAKILDRFATEIT